GLALDLHDATRRRLVGEAPLRGERGDPAAFPLGALGRRGDEHVAAAELAEAARAVAAESAVLDDGEERRAAGRVRILIGGHVDAARPRRLDEPERVADATPVAAAAGLVVGD